MGCLEHSSVGPDVRPGGEAEPADHSGPEVGDDVPVQVRAAQDVVFLRSQDELHAHVVDDAVLEIDVLVALGDLPRDGEEETVCVLHDVGLVDGGHLPAPIAARVVERELDDPL